ncbi:hypothetical protein [Phenylobacterium sp.]|uniref:hypothetical protein n=1 Tax=Phenylobacterium sp. TaxID=1871053 RepID=UPI002C2677FF|nr:hypothetical protein [Phenylobacterium sp.]HVI32897.1 hypothetical protein [Phenylobacterium sp.]
MTSWKAAAAALALLGATAATQARAQESPATTGDLNCAVVGFVLAASEDKEEQQAGLMLAFYYYGRLSAVGGGFNLEARLQEVAKGFTDETFGTQAQRCGDEFAKVGDSMKLVGDGMDEKR